MIIKHIAVAAALGMCSLASNALAETVVYTGAVEYDIEHNAFGLVSAADSYVNDSVTITFTENLANGYRPGYYVAPTAFWAGGNNPTFSGPSPVINATIVVTGGPSLSVAGTELGEQINSGVLNVGQFSYSREGGDNIIGFISAEIAGPNVPEFGNYSGPNLYVGFEAYFQTFDASSYGDIDGSLSSVTSDVTQNDIPSGVPEPSTWAMILLGFAGVGVAGYRRACPGSS